MTGLDPERIGSELVGSTPQKMRGTVVAEHEGGGWLADMSYPVAIPGVILHPDALCMLRSYQNPGARTRITNQHVPNQRVRLGDNVEALVDVITIETGSMVPNPDYVRYDYRSPREIPETEVALAGAVRWGVKA